jgi:hypothetical protein
VEQKIDNQDNIWYSCSCKCCIHYRKDGLCRASNDLPGAFYRAHGKDLSLPCAYDKTHGSDKRTVQTSLPCVVSRAHGKDISLPCIGPERTAKRPGHVRRPWHGGWLGRTLTVVSLSHAPYMKRTTQIFLCRAFLSGARQRLF